MEDKNSNQPQAKTKSTLFAVCESQFLGEVKNIG